MARILDFYRIRWEYEPHTFPILWNLDGTVVESFSPDFWLPDLELYLEMTTLRQKLVRKKNRKLRRIRVLARRDDIAFVEIHCPACRSESLGIVIASGTDDDAAVAVGPGLVYGEFGPHDEERFREALPIGSADLDVVHDLLARGGLAALVGGSEPPPAGTGR